MVRSHAAHALNGRDDEAAKAACSATGHGGVAKAWLHHPADALYWRPACRILPAAISTGMQRGDQRAGHVALTRTALLDKRSEGRLHAREVGQPVAYIGQPQRGQT